jgi:hypothetical protein
MMMAKFLRQAPRGAAFGLLLALAVIFLFETRGNASGEINMGPDRVAIEGYDTVAYFTRREAVSGSAQFTHGWKGAVWRFASAGNRDLFAADPEKFAPQYGGY